MKLLLKAVYELFESIGRAKAASHFARAGMYAEAKELMLAK